MNRFKGPYEKIHLLAPDEKRFDLEYKGEIYVEDIGYTIKPRSLYHYFIVQIVAELQKDYRKCFKNGVPPQIVLQYLKHQNDKFGLLRKKQIHKIDALKAAWRNHLRKGVKERISFYKKDKRIKLSDNDRVVFLQNLFLLSTKDKSKEGLFKINIDKTSGLNIVSPILKSRPPHKTHIIKDHQKKIVVTKDSFSQSHEALIGPYFLLAPVEAVLQDPPTIPGFGTPKYFRKTGPVAADIEGGKVHIRGEVSDIIKALEKHKIVLLSGYAAAGKTVLARLVAYRWFKYENKVRFIQLKTDSVELFALKNETAMFGEEKPDPLLVIEDAHLARDLINEFLSWRTQVWPKILVTTREPVPELPSVVINFFDPIYKIHLQPSDSAIITNFFKTKGWELSQELKREIINVSKGNLWLLSYALKTLNKTDGKEIQHKAIIDEVKRDIEDLGKIRRDLSDVTKNLMPRLLIALSILYRFEIPTDLRFIYQRFPYPKAQLQTALDELIKMGEVMLIGQRDNYYYGLPHSMLAELYFHFTTDSYWEETSAYGNRDDFLCDYLVSKNAGNREGLFICFNHFPKKIPLRKISKKLNKDKLGRRISESEGFNYAFYCIECIYRFDHEAAEDLAKHIDKAIFARRISETYDFSRAALFIKSLYKADSASGKELLRYIDKAKFASRITGTNDIESALFCISIICEADPVFGKELWGYIDKIKLASKISETTDVWQAGNYANRFFKEDDEFNKMILGEIKKLISKKPEKNEFNYFFSRIAIIYEANPKFGKELWAYIDKEKFASKMSKTKFKDFAVDFIGFLCKVDSADREEFWGYIDKAKLASGITETTGVGNAGYCINILYKADRERGKELWGYIDKEKFARRISVTTNVWGIGDCINMLYKADREIGKELWSYIDKAKLASRISEATKVWGAVKCINMLFKADREVGKELWSYIDKAKFASRISVTTDVRVAGRCISLLFKADHIIGKELWKFIDKGKFGVRNHEELLQWIDGDDLIFDLSPYMP